MNSEEKIALFDFCGTIVGFQTFDPYINYVLECEKGYRLFFSKSRFMKLLSKALSRVIPGFYLYKKWIVRLCRGLTLNSLESYGEKYYQEIVKPQLIPDTISLLESFQKQGYRLIIISAGCDLYIRFFAEEYNIRDLICTQLKFEGQICQGSIDGRDCIGDEKVKRFMTYARVVNMKDRPTAGVSDSQSDMPMLCLCDRKIIISKKRHQKWVDKEMEEIMWKK